MANRFLSNIRINDAYTFPASDGSFGQAIITDGAGNLSFGNVASGGDADAASVIYKDNFTGDGVETQFSMANGITNEDQTQIFIDGVYQEKGTYSVSGNVITFSEAPISGHSIEVMTIASINTGPTTLYQDNFTGNGATTDFTLANSVNNEIKTLVFLNGVYQFKDTYSVSGTTLSFDTAPANGTLIEVITIGSAAAADYNQTLLFYGKASAAITKGQAVMFAGVQGDHFLVAPAVQATIDTNHEYMLGIANQDFANNEFGYITEFGRVSGLNTSAYTAGAIIWYDSASGTAGAITTTEPTPPNAKIQLAAVIRSHATEGVLFVRPNIYYGLEELENVNVTGLADRDLLVYNNSTGNWVNDTLDADEIDDTSTTNKFTSQAEIDKLAGIEAGAQVNTLDGSGTANYVSKWSDADTITNSSIQDDGSTVSVGGNLTVTGSLTGTLATAAQPNITSVGTLSSLAISGDVSIGDKIIHLFDTDTSIRFPSVNTVSIETGGSERVRVTSTGNVGIGTSSPADKLDVVGNAIISGNLTVDTNTLVVKSFGNRVGIGTDSPLSTLDVVGDANISGSLTVDTNTLFVDAANNRVGVKTLTPNNNLHVYDASANVVATFESGDANAYISFKDSDTTGYDDVFIGAVDTDFVIHTGTGSEKMRIDSSGSVGIGESNPASLLHLTSNNDGGNNNVVLRFEDTDGNTGNNQPLGQIQFYGNDGSGAGQGIKVGIKAFSLNNVGKSYLTFSTSDDVSNDQERMRIDSSGNVGIGTASPAEKVHIEGNNSKLKITNTNTTATGYHGIIFESLDAAGFTTQSLGQIDFVTSAGATGLSARIKGEMSNTSGAGNIVFSAGAAGAASEIARITANGITFNGDTAAANALDDYEEGTWTPVWNFSTSGSVTPSFLSTNYTKVGRKVTVTAYLRTSAISSPSGNATITGLPFAVSGVGAVALGGIFRWATDMPNINAEVGASSIIFYKSATNSASLTPLAGSDFNGGSNQNVMVITATYFV